MSDREATGGTLAGGESGADEEPSTDRAELAAQVDLLQEENRRLREEYRRARQTRYRETAVGMAALGLLALVGAVLFPTTRSVLLALSGTGLFAAVLLYALTPERFVAASVGEHVFDAHARTGAELVADLGLAETRVYLPGGDDSRLFVPQRTPFEVPDRDDIEGPFVVADAARGVALPTTGAGLYREFEQGLTRSIADDQHALADQLADALVEGFELVDGARPATEEGRLTVGIVDSAYPTLDAFDHPVVSFLGVGVAEAMGEPVAVEVTDGDDRVEATVTVRWPVGQSSTQPSDR